MMDTAANANRFFMVESSRRGLGRSAPFYQAIAPKLIEGALADSQIEYLIRVLDHASSVRRFDVVASLAGALATAPVPIAIRGVALYFAGLAQVHHRELAQAYALLERAATHATGPFASRSILSLGAVSALSGDTNLQRRSYARALQSRDPFTLLHAGKMMAVLDACEGNHRSSVGQLEQMFSFVRTYSSRLHPQSYYDYLNSLACEMSQVGRLEEATNISRLVLASPFSWAYPEWHETRAEIELRGQRASRSLVSIRPLQKANVLEFRPRGNEQDTVLNGTGCRVLRNFAEKVMAKKTGDRTSDPNADRLRAMSTQEKQKEAVRLLLYEDSTEDEAVDTVLRVLNLSPSSRKRLEAYLDKIAGDAQDEKA